MKTNFIDEKILLEHLRISCQKRIVAAAEPVIQEAMKEIESRMREKLGSIVVGMLDTSINVCRDEREIRITVLHTVQRDL